MLAVVVVVAVAYVAAGWYLSAPGSFWSPDSAVRFVQLESLRRQGYRSLAVVYPAAEFDPAQEFYPIREGFSYRRDGRMYLSYPWLFPLLTAPFYGWLGHPGLLVLPALAALVVTWSVARTAVGEGLLAGTAAAVLVGLASPLLVYAAVFWDHSLLAALATGAVVVLLPEGSGAGPAGPRALAAGLLLGLGPCFRNEAYTFLVAALLGLYVAGARRSIPWVAAGAAIVLVPLWTYHLWWFGHPLGYKGRAVLEAAAQPGLGGYLRNRVLVAYDLLLSVEHYVNALRPERIVEASVVAFGVVTGVRLLRAGIRTADRFLVGTGGVVLAAVCAGVYLLRLPVMGLLPSAPFVALAWIRDPADGRDRFLWTLAGAYVAGVVAVGSVGGLQWGPRYLLPVIPVLGLLCARSVGWVWRRQPRLRGTLALSLGLLALCGFALQTRGLQFIRYSLDTVRLIEDHLQATRYEVVATGYEPLFRLLGHLYFRKKLLVVDSQDELRALVAQLAARRVEGWTYLPRYGGTFDPRLVERWTQGGPWRFRVEEDRTPVVVEFGGPWPIRLVTYRGGR